MGCDDRFIREDQEEHTRQNSQKHLTLTASLAVETKEQLQQKLLEQDKKHKVEEEILRKKIDEQEKRIEKLEKKLANQDKEQKELEKKLGKEQKELEKKLANQDKEQKELEKKVANQGKEQKELEKKLANQDKEQKELEKKVANQGKEQKELEKKLGKEKELEKKLANQDKEEHKKQEKALKEEQEQKLKEQKEFLEQQLDLKLQGLEQKLLDITVRSSNRKFEMKNYSVKKAKDKTDDWYSPPMYTHICGYKFCIGITANGKLRGYANTIYVALFAMPGDYDSQLKWPAMVKFTIELINQRGRGNISHSGMWSWNKPIATYKFLGSFCGSGVGFLEHSKLNSFLTNDTLQFYVSKVELL